VVVKIVISFKGVLKGEVKFKGFSRDSRVSRVGGHHGYVVVELLSG